MHVSEIRVNQIRVNQGLGVQANIFWFKLMFSERPLDVFIWKKKMYGNISVFLPYLSKIDQINKIMKIIILEDK